MATQQKQCSIKSVETLMPTNLPFVRHETNRKLLAAVQESAGGELEWPISTPECLSVLAIMGYRADSFCLQYCLRQDYFAAPPKEGNHYRWSASHVVEFADTLESMRRWLPLHECHRHKLEPRELEQQAREAAGKQALYAQYDQLDPAQLINLLVSIEDSELRSMLAHILKAKLGIVCDSPERAAITMPENN